MPSIGDRIRKVAVATHATHVPLLPFDCCIGFLENHTLLCVMDVDVHKVHKVIVDLHTWKQRTATATTTTTQSTQSTTARCTECNVGHVVLDEREGVPVCVRCGLVQVRGTVNVSPEYDEPPVPSKRKRDDDTIPWYVRRMCNAQREVTFAHELAHWNAFVGHSEDTLSALNHMLTTWKPTGVDEQSKIAGVLLYDSVAKQMTEANWEKRVRDNTVSHGSSMIVGDSVSKPTFPCPACGRLEHSRKSATYHCRWRKGR